MQEEPKNITIELPSNRKIAEETEKTWYDGWWTFLKENQDGSFTLRLVEKYKPERRTSEEIEENNRIFKEIQQCGGLDGYLTKKLLATEMREIKSI